MCDSAPSSVSRHRLAARRVLDLAYTTASAVRREGARIDQFAAAQEPLSVLVLSICGQRGPKYLVPACAELLASNHRVQIQIGSVSGTPPTGLAEHTVLTDLKGGKAKLLNVLWSHWLESDGSLPDWLLFLDDDIRFPRRFLDRFLAVAEQLGFTMAQPAQSRRSHAAWPVTRRHWGSVARETRFTEIGPVMALRREAVEYLMPLPALEIMDMGIDLHWSWVAEERGWRRGVVDATPIRHEDHPLGASYKLELARREGAAFLATHPHLTAEEANTTLRSYRRLDPGPLTGVRL